MARPINQIQNFRNDIRILLDAMNKASNEALIIDYLGGQSFYRAELEKVDEAGTPIYDITTAQFTAAINALASLQTLLSADNQALGKALARLRD